MNKAIILSILATVALIGCNNKNDNSTSNSLKDSSDLKFEDTLSSKQKDLIHFKFLTAVANLPSPFEMINMVYSSKLPYNDKLLNPISSVSRYKSAAQKAYNYGSYGVDLSYIGFYGSKQNLLSYYNTVKQLSKELNIEKIFDDYAGKFYDYQDNKDSMIVLLDRAFSETDAYLRNYKRHLTAAQVLSGAIIETHYLSIELMKFEDRDNRTNDLYNRIYNHKLYFYHLVNLLEEFKTDKEAAALLTAIKEYSDFYNTTVTSEEQLNKETLGKLSEKVTALRNKFI